MVRSVGVASAAAAIALGVAGTASACTISEFTSSISCDQPSGKGVITVLDQDISQSKVTITVQSGNNTVATQADVVGNGDTGTKVTFPGIDWTQGATYTVHVTRLSHGQQVLVGDEKVTVPNEACTAPKAQPTSAAPTPTQKAPAPAPAASSAAAVADTASPSPSPSGNLAETGGSGSTGTIAGIAGALVVVGGGAVFMLRRRTASARH